MEFEYIREINYYETDKMGVVHHSNYIRFLEEARCRWMKELGLPMEKLEEFRQFEQCLSGDVLVCNV